MYIEILRPYLLLLIPIIILFFIGSVKLLKIKYNAKLKKSLILHVLTGILLILALSGLSVKWRNETITTIYIADLSDSTKFYQQNIQTFIENAINEMPAKENAGIITFGSDTRLEQFVTDKKVFSKFEAIPNRSSTNIEEAVSAALALLNNDTAKRIVLLTDGYENSGSIENIAASVAANQIDFKVVKIEKGDVSEVYVNNLEIPDKINIGDQFSVKIEIISNRVTNATIYLYSGRTLKTQETVELQTGTNHFVFKDTQLDGGLKNYKVIIEAEEDTESINNEYSAYTTIQTAPQILVVEGRTGAADEFLKILQAIHVDYKKISPSGTPENIGQMLEYKSIITVDVHRDDLKDEFLNTLETYVKDYAGGFVAIGGENSFALGNYKDSPLETILPVYMDLQGKKEIPPMALVLVIDKSGSMSDGNGRITNLALAKEAAIKALDNLRTIDSVGILSFDDSFTWTSKLDKLSDYDKVRERVLGISIEGGTSIYPAVKEAVKALKENDAKLKHIILLTDGQDGHNQYQDVITEMTEYGITLSTVSVGEDADIQTLQKLAEDGNGR